MKLLLLLLGLINGSFMLLDGIYVLLTGKYIGPEKPGPWAMLFQQLNIPVFKLGPLFIVYGIAWLVWVYSLYMGYSWAWVSGLVIAVATLWYLPVGTAISVIVLIVLLTARGKLGI